MYDVTITLCLCFHQQKGLKAKNVIMMSNCKLVLIFELSDPKLVSISNFSSNVTNWYDLQICLKDVSLNSESFSSIA